MEKTKTIVGAVERVSLPDWGVNNIVAKIDTGASVSTLHVIHIREDVIEGTPVLRFTIPQSITGTEKKRIEITDFKITPVRSSNGLKQDRYFIRTSIELKGKKIDNMAITLSDRSQLPTPMLIGNEVLSNGYLVDVSISNSKTKKSL